MEKYPAPAPASEPQLKESAAAELEFLVAPDFLSHPPQLNAQVMLRRIEENMPWCSTRPGEKERRLATKVTVEFVL
jgi:hypothetical protein